MYNKNWIIYVIKLTTLLKIRIETKKIRMNFVLSSPKWIDSLLLTNQSHTFSSSVFKTFLIFVTFLCWQKLFVSSAYRYVWVFDKASWILFMYSKNSKGPNIDLWETQQFMVPASKNSVPNETKITLSVK